MNMKQSRTQNAKRNIFWGLVQKMVSLLCPFLVRTAMIYYLGSLYVGLNGLFTSILQVLSLAELGFGEAMVFSMYKPIAEDNKEEICALLALYKKIYTIIGIVVFAVGLLLLPFLKVLIKGEVPNGINIYILYIIYLVNTCLSYFLFAYKSSLFVASQRTDIKTNIGTITMLAMYVLQLVSLLAFRNYYLYCVAIPVTTIINNLLVEYRAKKLYPEYVPMGRVSDSHAQDIRKRVIGLFTYKVCGVFRNSFDSIIISAFLGLTVLVQYQNYYFILNSITGFMLIITSSIMAGVGNSMASESCEKNYKDFTKFQYIYMWITNWCTVCLFCLYQPFMIIWVGEDLVFSTTVMIIFCIYFFTSQMGNICYVYRQAAGLWWQDRYRPIVEAIVNLTLNIILVKMIGVSGVLLSTILCLIFINCIWGAWILFKYYFIKVPERGYLLRLLYYAFVTVCSCFISITISKLFIVQGFINLFVRLVISCVISNIVFIVFTSILPEHRDAFAFIKRVVSRKN